MKAAFTWLSGALVSSIMACGATVSSNTSVEPGPGSDAAVAVDASADGGLALDAAAESGSKPDAREMCVECIDKSLEWGLNGGRGATVVKSTVSACRSYGQTRTSQGVQSELCSFDLAGCFSDTSGISDVRAALAYPDVVAAFQAPVPPVFGRDTRPVDGEVFRITYGGKSIDVGTPCPQPLAGCTPVPVGVGDLASLLKSLDRNAAPRCQ
jgi:hypothetical protein